MQSSLKDAQVTLDNLRKLRGLLEAASQDHSQADGMDLRPYARATEVLSMLPETSDEEAAAVRKALGDELPQVAAAALSLATSLQGSRGLTGLLSWCDEQFTNNALVRCCRKNSCRCCKQAELPQTFDGLMAASEP